MELDGMSAAIAVDRDWAESKSLRYLLGPRSQACSEAGGLDLIEAKILDGRDSRGLWIEINTERHALDPYVPLGRLMIPWRCVSTILLEVPEGPDGPRSLGEFHDLIDRIGFKETDAVRSQT